MPNEYLSEHAAPEVTTSRDSGYTPDANAKKAIKLADDLLKKAKKHRKQYDERWLDYYKMFRGQQWKEQRPSYRHSEVINMVFQSIQSTVPIQTDARPRIQFLPTEPGDMQLSEMINSACESDWERKNWLSILTDVVYDSNFYGTGFGYMGIEEGEDGTPEICFEAADPFYFYPDPNARDVNEKRCKYVVYAEPVDVSVLKVEYPDNAKHFKGDVLDAVQGNKLRSDPIKYKSPVDNTTVIEGDGQLDTSRNDQCLKVTVWVHSDEFDEEKKEQQDPETGAVTTEYEQKLKYPKGRKIVVAGGVLCEDDANPYEDGKFPYARLVNYTLPREFFGVSEVEPLESPQKIFNKTLSFALDIMTLTGNPIWVVDTTSGVDTDNITNRPGMIIEKEPGSEVRREAGVDINPAVFQLVDRIRSWFNDTAGSQDVTRGAKPEGITAMGAITALQEAAQTRLRLKARHLDSFIQQMGQLYVSRVFQFYTAPRIFRLTNDQGAAQYFKMHIEPVMDEMGQPVTNPDGTPARKALVRSYLQNPETGEYSEDLEAKEFQVRGKFDVKVGTGSSLPFAKAEKFAQAEKMFTMGAIDQQALLEASDYPNWETIMARMEAKAAEAAAMAAAPMPGDPAADPMADPGAAPPMEAGPPMPAA